LNLSQNLYVLQSFGILKLVQKKVVPYVTSNLHAKVGEIWTPGKSSFRISKFGCLKILKNQKEANVHLSTAAAA
jgi:hypothetical protein